MGRDAVADVNGNWVRAFETLAAYQTAGATQSFGGVTAVSTGVPVPLFNPVFVFEPPARDELAAAVSWMADREPPFQMTVADTALDAVAPLASDLRLERDEDPMPGMVLSPLDEIPDQEAPAEIDEVVDADEMEAFATVTAAAFELPMDIARQLSPPELVSDDELQVFLGRVDGHPVACGLLVRTGDVAGVYNVGVIDEYRRRGIGEAITWAVLRAGRDAGCTTGVLQSSSMGYSVYERMGFETVVDYHRFHPA